MGEWREHSGRYGRRWQVLMASRRKLLSAPTFGSASLGAALSSCGLSQSAVVAAKKDFHLIEAAIATDLLVISLDDRARAIFASAADRIRQFGPICWINPVQQREYLGRWLNGEMDTPRDWNLDPERERV